MATTKLSNNFIENCEATIAKVQEELRNNEWKGKYENYAKDIALNLEMIKKKKKQFHQWEPINLYMNITQAKGSTNFSLRYLGQNIAALNVKNNEVFISTEKSTLQNKKNFGIDTVLKNVEWSSKEAANFRKKFQKKPKRMDHGKKNNEHRIENVLLKEFAKKSASTKQITNIQPVKLADTAYFQMPTALRASKQNKINFAEKGGGIDILARIKKGSKSTLCIMEVKDENKPNEPATKAIQQALAYATFIRELLRSDGGKTWWKLFGFNGALPQKLNLIVAVAMPDGDKQEMFSEGIEFIIENDKLILHQLYFKTEGDKLKIVKHTF